MRNRTSRSLDIHDAQCRRHLSPAEARFFDFLEFPEGGKGKKTIGQGGRRCHARDRA
jgi:hypothetical protein